MRKNFFIGIFLFLLFSFSAALAGEYPTRPLSRSEVLALLAGAALPENVAKAIKTQGLTFKPDAAYTTLAKRAGADTVVLAALTAGQTKASAQPSPEQEKPDLLEQLTRAAELMRGDRQGEAARALGAAIQSSSDNLAAAFVMGELLRRQQEWMRAFMVYTEVLRQDPDFPEVHTKLSYIHYRLGDGEATIAEAKAALRRTPENPEAHKNMGLGLDVQRKFDAAILAYREALRFKPDYAAVRYNLGVLYFNKGDLENSILEYKKAIALQPNDSDAHINLGNTYQKKGDVGAAIREYREAKRLAPGDIEPRLNLANALIHQDARGAIAEFHDMEKMFPESVLCHVCFGNAYLDHAYWGNKDDYAAAMEQFRIAIRLDPSEAEAHAGLGEALLGQKNSDAALREFIEAERLDPDSIRAHRGLGNIYLEQKDYDRAISEWRMVTSLDARDANAHYSLGQTFAAKGEPEKAIAEYQEALKLNPHAATFLRIAELLEKKGDYIAALDNYRRAAEVGATTETRQRYEAADARFASHIAALKASGRTAEAAELEAARAANGRDAAANLPMQWQASTDAGMAALQSSRLEEAEKAFKTAIELAEKLHPRDDRLTSSLLQLGAVYARQERFAEAENYKRRGLIVAEQLHGPGSVETLYPLVGIGIVLEQHHQFDQAETYYLRGLQIAEKYYGPRNFNVAGVVGRLGEMYFNQRQFDKAEPMYLRQLENEEARVGEDNIEVVRPVERVGSLYSAWGKYEKAEPYYRRALALQEKQFGVNSPALGSTLTALANLKRNMGAAKEAKELEKRRDKVLSASVASPK